MRAQYNFICTLLQSAMDLGELKAMPTNLPPRPKQAKKLPDCPSMEEINTLMAVAKGWVRGACALGIYAGLRSGEIRALRVGDIDFESKGIFVRRAMSDDEEDTTKGDADRVVPIMPEFEPILREPCRNKLPGARMVVNSKGRTPRRQAVWDALARLQKRNGLRHLSVQSLRRAFCTHLERRGWTRKRSGFLQGTRTSRPPRATCTQTRFACVASSVGQLAGNAATSEIGDPKKQLRDDENGRGERIRIPGHHSCGQACAFAWISTIPRPAHPTRTDTIRPKPMEAGRTGWEL